MIRVCSISGVVSKASHRFTVALGPKQQLLQHPGKFYHSHAPSQGTWVIRHKLPSSGKNLPWQGFAMGTFTTGCIIVNMMIPPGAVLSWNQDRQQLMATECEATTTLTTDSTTRTVQRKPTIRVQITDHDKESLWMTLRRILRVIRRIFKLSITLSPIVALYPMQYLCGVILDPNRISNGEGIQDAHDIALASLAGSSSNRPWGPTGWYYDLCLYCVECSGAAAIKMMQWAGSRPDMFGQDFCSVFSQLQDDTTPHSWNHTERLLRKTFGRHWEKRIRLDEILGSGCIAQVYKGVIYEEDGTERPVAVKVMHPNVEDDIDADLDIMRIVVHILERLPFQTTKDLQWINLPGFVEEIAGMLKIQLDLRTEATHLRRFERNFQNNNLIHFPQLIEGYRPTKEVLVETFCEGEPINDFIRKNTEQPKVLHEMCVGAVRAVCQMIFVDNFTHGDLHPGNILVNSKNQLVLLDAGIVVEHSKKDHRLISDVLAAFIRRDGRRAGERMMEDSNDRLADIGGIGGNHERSVHEEEFLYKIASLTERAHGKTYFMEHLGTYISFICDSAARHHVMLNQAFISAALAVKVQEGIALALDPRVEVWKIAIPIILQGERKHGYAMDHAKEVIGLDRWTNWVKGFLSSSSSGDKTR